jgi:hypothetical protein
VNEACGKYEETIQLYLDGHLSEEERSALEMHIKGCVSCKAEVEAFSVLFSGLENLPLDEPAADFNAAVLSRIPFPVREPAPVRWSILGIRPGIPLTLSFIMIVATLSFYQIIANSAKITSFISGSFLKALNATEWLGMSSLQGVVDIANLATTLPILRSLTMVGKILLNATSATVSDPLVAFMLSVMTIIGIVTTVMMAKVMRPGLRHISANGAEISNVMHF